MGNRQSKYLLLRLLISLYSLWIRKTALKTKQSKTTITIKNSLFLRNGKWLFKAQCFIFYTGVDVCDDVVQ